MIRDKVFKVQANWEYEWVFDSYSVDSPSIYTNYKLRFYNIPCKLSILVCNKTVAFCSVKHFSQFSVYCFQLTNNSSLNDSDYVFSLQCSFIRFNKQLPLQILFAERTIKLFKNQIWTQFLWTFSKKLAFSFSIIPPQAIYFPSKFC